VPEVVAALDCGSNSTRLLIDTSGEALRREMRITRLSEGVDATGALSALALQRSYAVLGEYRTLMDECGVSRGLLCATSAVRDASNGEDFLEQAQRITGVDARILSGEEEARFSYAGATADLDVDERVTLIVDVGGGSTELAMMVGNLMHSFSMQLGCVRVTERALGSDVVNPERDALARDMIGRELDRAWSSVPAFSLVVGDVRLVGLAGTVATLAQLDQALVHYDRHAVHHRVLTRDVVEKWRDILSTETPQARLLHPGMVAGREDVLHAGLYILDAVMERFGVSELLSSENDILDGITQALLAG
jgi:exopolyphosphatase/guanosine-5'-triphosphate,3'-diphosphate pyrophosphatase